MSNNNKKSQQSQQPVFQEPDLSNVYDFPLGSNAEFNNLMRTHLKNLELSFGRRRVVEFIKQAYGLEQQQTKRTGWFAA